MPPPHECVVASAQWPLGHDVGASPTHLPPPAVHAFGDGTQSNPTVQPFAFLTGTVLPPGQKVGGSGVSSGHVGGGGGGGRTQSKPPGQPFAPVRGTIFPPGQNPGAGGESTGQEMQQATPTPGPHDTLVASAKCPPAHDDGERPTHAPPAAAQDFFRPAFTSESVEPVGSESSAAGAGSSAALLHAARTGRTRARERAKEESACFIPGDWPCLMVPVWGSS